MRHQICVLTYLIVCFIVQYGNCKRVKVSDGFVQTKGTHFILNGKPLYVNGFNAYWLMTLASDPSTRSKVTSSFQQASKHGLNLGRSLAFNDGDIKPLQISPGSYDEDVFRAVITRMNSINGLLYKDDQTVFSWELMNEPRFPNDSGNSIQNWVTEMAAYVKSIDSNHLLNIGNEGFYGETMKQLNPLHINFGTDFIKNNQIPQIDFATFHLYDDRWLPNTTERGKSIFVDKWIAAHLKDADTILRKPIILAEFGKSSRESPEYSIAKRDNFFKKIYNAIYTSAISGGSCAGGFFWQLLSQGMDSYGDGYEVILKNSSTSTGRIIKQQSTMMSNIKL